MIVSGSLTSGESPPECPGVGELSAGKPEPVQCLEGQGADKRPEGVSLGAFHRQMPNTLSAKVYEKEPGASMLLGYEPFSQQVLRPPVAEVVDGGGILIVLAIGTFRKINGRCDQ